ncbi:MAG TPA: hypothetical protein VI072_30510 [Polyangiaceae bacterium]
MAQHSSRGFSAWAQRCPYGLFALAVLACGPTNPGGTGGAGGTGGGSPAIPFACPGGTIAPGNNTITVNGVPRAFHADFPTDRSRSMGVLFSWHGFTDTVENHRRISGLNPNADPAQPVVVVTPDDTGILPPLGLDWDIGKGTPADPNVDISFFEAMLGCLNVQYPIDATRIYSYGFSAGSVMTSLLHSRHPKLLSAIVNVSGAWFNDPAQEAMVNVFEVDWNWPPLNPEDGGAVLLTHGGPGDVTILNVMDLERAAQAAFPFLKAANRVVVDCPHNRGHIIHPEVTGAVVSRFISAHRAGQPSPYRTGGYQGLPASCNLRLP